MKRAKLPLWRWDPFLVALVLALSVAGAVFQRLDLPVVSPVALTLLLAVAIAATVCLVLPFFVQRLRRDGEGTLVLDAGTVLRPATAHSAGAPVERAAAAQPALSAQPAAAVQPENWLPVLDGRRHRDSVDAALARGGSEFDAVLVPRATAWFGREYRVAVDILVGSRLYRAGYLPRESDAAIAPVLEILAAGNTYLTVPVRFRNTEKGRDIAVRVGLPLTGTARE